MEHYYASSVSYTTLHVLVIFFQFVQSMALASNQTSPLFPAVIVFGDSIVDPGNNNVIDTIAKCNFPPYGKDFEGQKPTGRFCNGRIPSDFIASKLGIKELVPAYLGTELQPEDILTGVSFASGASGYDPLTPKLVSVLSLSDQLELFKDYKEKVKAIAGEVRAAVIISESLYVICTGTDDLGNTYFATPFRKLHYDIPSYIKFMTTSASSFLQQLYILGARNIALVGLPPLGCLPSQRTLSGGIFRDCEPSRNQAAMLFNSKIRLEVKRLTGEFEGTKIVYFDIYSILLDLIQRPSSYGFEESTKGCCGTGKLEATFLCNSLTASTCADDTKYVFWDSYHPTERAYGIIVDELVQNYLHYFF